MENRKIAYEKWYNETYGDVKNKILVLLMNTTLTQDEICTKLNIKKGRITFLMKKYKIKRKKVRTEKQIAASKANIQNIIDDNLKRNSGIRTKEHYEKIFKTRFGYDYSEFLKQQTEYKKYYNKVRNITNKNLRKYKHLFDNLDKLGRCGDDDKFQVDHIFSIKEGFNLNIVPELIGHPSNLRVIHWKDNLNKSNNCDISLEILMNNANEFLTKHHKIII